MQSMIQMQALCDLLRAHLSYDKWALGDYLSFSI